MPLVTSERKGSLYMLRDINHLNHFVKKKTTLSMFRSFFPLLGATLVPPEQKEALCTCPVFLLEVQDTELWVYHPAVCFQTIFKSHPPEQLEINYF